MPDVTMPPRAVYSAIRQVVMPLLDAATLFMAARRYALR